MTKAIKFHLDESVRLTIVAPLRQRGIDITTPGDAKLLGRSDREHLEFSAQENRILVTHDTDFIRLHTSGLEHAGIAYCHQSKYGTSELIQFLVLLHSCYGAEEMRNRVEWI